MPSQFSPNIDKRLDELDHRLGFDEWLIKRYTADKDEAWEQVLSYMAEFPDVTRFLGSDGYVLNKQARQGTPALDAEELRRRLMALNPKGFVRLWNAITIKVPDPLLVEKAMQRGRIPAEVVHASMNVPPISYARVRREWTKEDVNRAVIFDVKIDDPLEARQERLEKLREEVRALEAELAPPATPA